MPHIEFLDEALLDIERFKQFLLDLDAPIEVVDDAISTIISTIKTLIDNPLSGEPHPIRGFKELRRKTISFGSNGGYIALYSYHENRDLILIHAMRHQRELEARFIRRIQKRI
jgi:plasmid stabilization system protein ParE